MLYFYLNGPTISTNRFRISDSINRFPYLVFGCIRDKLPLPPFFLFPLFCGIDISFIGSQAAIWKDITLLFIDYRKAKVRAFFVTIFCEKLNNGDRI